MSNFWENMIRQKPGDVYIDTYTYNRHLDITEAIGRIEFDPADFKVFNDGPSGMKVMLNDGRAVAERLWLVQYSTTTVNVTTGKRNINGVSLDWTSGGVGDVSFAAAGDGVYYVYLLNSVATYDPDIVGGTLTAVKSTVNTWPITTIADVDKYVLGSVTIASGVISDVSQFWRGNDITEYTAMPDASSVAADQFTLEYRPGGYGNMQLFNVDSLTALQPNVPYVNVTAGPVRTLQYAPPDGDAAASSAASIEIAAGVVQFAKWATASNVAIDAAADLIPYKDVTDGIADYMTVVQLFADAMDNATIVADVAGSINTSLEHTDLDFSNSTQGNAGQNQDHDARYFILGDNYTQNYGESFGNDNADMVIDLDNERLVTAGGATRLDWKLRQLDDGDWTVVGAGNDLIVEGTQAAVSLATGALRVAGGMSVANSVYMETGIYIIKLLDTAASQAGYFTDGVSEIFLCDGVDAITATGAVEVRADMRVTVAGDYYHDSKQGTTKTDKFLVISDDSGGDWKFKLSGGIVYGLVAA